MLRLLIDTCVWIDLAKDHHQHGLLRILDQLITENKVVVLLPHVVRDEFQRNKSNIVEKNTQSLSSALKRAKEVLARYGDTTAKAEALGQLNYVDQRLPRLGDTTGIVAFIEQLLGRAEPIDISDAAKTKAAERALAKKAPFHRNRNSVADAVLIETFAALAKGKGSKGHTYGFVTHNKNDFSQPDGDGRKPHLDFADIFTSRKIRYFITLKDAIQKVQSRAVDELEYAEYVEQPRPTDEIVELISELLDRVWYNRHLVLRQNVEEGRDKCDPDIMAGAIESAEKIEKKYGRNSLGPYSDFEWGMMNGKLSALRWVLGEDWETTLDT